jgi:uncharacterized protein YukE
MYKELAAHLSQLDGVTTELILPDRQEFNYNASQIAGIYISSTSQISERSQALIGAILDRYGAWQVQVSSAIPT